MSHGLNADHVLTFVPFAAVAGMLIAAGAVVPAEARRRRAGGPQFQQGYDRAAALVDAEPSNVTFVRRMSSGHSHFALLEARAGSLDVAWTHQQQALAVRQRLVDQNPSDRRAAIDLMVSQMETGDVLVRRRAFDDAAAHYRLTIARAETLVQSDPRYVYFRVTLASALTRLARTLVAINRAEEAEPLAARARSLSESAFAADRADARLQFETAFAQATLGDVAAAKRDPQARVWRQRALDTLIAMRDSGRLAGGTLNGDEPKLMAGLQKNVAE